MSCPISPPGPAARRERDLHPVREAEQGAEHGSGSESGTAWYDNRQSAAMLTKEFLEACPQPCRHGHPLATIAPQNLRDPGSRSLHQGMETESRHEEHG